MGMHSNKSLRPLWRGLPIVIVSVTLFILAARWYLRHAIPMYESTARIRLADPHYGEASANLYKDFDVFSSTNQIGTEVEMVKARVLVEKTLDSIDMQTIVYRVGRLMKKELYKDNPIVVKMKILNQHWYGENFALHVLSLNSYVIEVPVTKQKYKGYFGHILSIPGADILLDKDTAVIRSNDDFVFIDHYSIVSYNRDQAVDKIIDKLDITSVDKDIPILRLIFKSAVPQKAADFVNILANTYMRDYIEAKCKAADITVDFLSRQLDAIEKKLVHSEDTIVAYRDEQSIINTHQETETDLRKIAQLKVQQTNLRMSLAAIDTLDAYMQKGQVNFLELAPNFEAFTDLLSTEIVKKIKQLQADKKDLLLEFTDKDEKVKVVDEKIADLSAYLLESIHNSRKDVQVKYDQIGEAIRQAEKVFVGLPGKEKNMGILERESGLNEKIYTYLHQKRTEAEIARAATISFHRVVARGIVPVLPVSPNHVVITGVSAILGLLLSLSSIYGVHRFKAKVNDSETIERSSETPLAVEIPYLPDGKQARHYFNDCATRLELGAVLFYPAVVAVSSFCGEEGKSFITAGIAAGVTALQHKVLVADAGGKLLPGGCGGAEYLLLREETTDEVLLREELKEKLAAWKNKYDLVLLCNMPIDASANAIVYMSLADVNLFVLDARTTPARKIVEADLLKERYRLGGLYYVLNRVDYNPALIPELWSRIKKRFTRNKLKQI